MLKLTFCPTLAALLAIFCCAAPAAADLICLKSVLSLGKIKHSVKIVAAAPCPSGHNKILDTVVSQPPGIKGLTSQVALADSADSTSPKTVEVTCPVGTSLVGGGAGVYEGFGATANLPVALSYSGPKILSASPTYAARAYETISTGSDWGLFAIAYCAKINT